MKKYIISIFVLLLLNTAPSFAMRGWLSGKKEQGQELTIISDHDSSDSESSQYETQVTIVKIPFDTPYGGAFANPPLKKMSESRNKIKEELKNAIPLLLRMTPKDPNGLLALFQATQETALQKKHTAALLEYKKKKKDREKTFSLNTSISLETMVTSKALLAPLVSGITSEEKPQKRTINYNALDEQIAKQLNTIQKALIGINKTYFILKEQNQAAKKAFEEKWGYPPHVLKEDEPISLNTFLLYAPQEIVDKYLGKDKDSTK